MVILSTLGALVIGAVLGFGVLYLLQNVTLKKGKRK